MSHFEYLTVAVSLILSFGLVRLIDGLWPAVRSTSRYPTHWAWVTFKLYSSVMYWWTNWNYKDHDWNLVGFVWMLAGPLLLYGQATLLAPRNADSVADWRVHYFSVARPLLALQFIYVIQQASGVYMFSSAPETMMFVVLGLAGIVAVAGLVSLNRTLHGVVIVANWLLIALAGLINFNF